MKICRTSGFANIKVLADTLKVSEITIRRDLVLLENLKLIRRGKKGAVPVQSQSLNDFVHYRIDDEYQKKVDQKRKIGQKAVSIIQPGETIIFDSGSTLWYTVQALPDNIPITAICYGLNIAEILNKKHIGQLIIMGGIYHKDTDMCESFSEVDVFGSIRAQKAFISAFGVHPKAGLTSGSFFASLMRKKIISSSDKTILLADSSKFGKIEWAHFADIKDVNMIITDQGIEKEYIEIFSEMGITIYTL